MNIQTIWKFELEVTDEQQIKLPARAQILKFAADPINPTKIFLWAKVNIQRADLHDWMDQPHTFETRSFCVFGTGHPMDSGPGNAQLQFHDTVLAGGGALVWHIFEVV